MNPSRCPRPCHKVPVAHLTVHPPDHPRHLILGVQGAQVVVLLNLGGI